MKKIRNGIVMILLLCLLCGCSFAAEKEEDRRDLAYTVVSDDELTAELKDLIETKKAEPFKMTYEDQGYLYIVQGFGQKPAGGFSIQLQELYETENAIYFSALLIRTRGAKCTCGFVSVYCRKDGVSGEDSCFQFLEMIK